MRYGLALLIGLTWALWFGGLMALFLLVSHLFASDRPTAVLAAPRMFVAFARYQILLAAVALVATVAWRLTTPRALLTALFSLFAVAAVATVLIASVITPKMERLRLAGESATPEFRRLHGQSMIAYVAEAAALLVAGFLVGIGIRSATVLPDAANANPPAPTPPTDPAWAPGETSR